MTHSLFTEICDFGFLYNTRDWNITAERDSKLGGKAAKIRDRARRENRHFSIDIQYRSVFSLRMNWSDYSLRLFIYSPTDFSLTDALLTHVMSDIVLVLSHIPFHISYHTQHSTEQFVPKYRKCYYEIFINRVEGKNWKTLLQHLTQYEHKDGQERCTSVNVIF